MAELEKCTICGKEMKNLGTHVRMAHPPTVGDNSTGQTNVPPDQGVVPPESHPEQGKPDMYQMMSEMMSVVNTLDGRLKKIEDKDRTDKFKDNVLPGDIEKAREDRQGIDSKIVKIVDEILGEDFGIRVEPRNDQPGFLFTVVVPPRLSDLQKSSRPILNKETGEYQTDKTGRTIEEVYQPEDQRSRAISSYQSYDAIKDHCEKVRSYIVAYYQKLQRPIPEFRLKSNV